MPRATNTRRRGTRRRACAFSVRDGVDDMRSLISIVSLSIVLAAAGPCRAGEGLAKTLERELQAIECPGALVAIAAGADAPQVFCLGVADVKSKSPMRRDFHMRIGSVTKPFVGTVVLQLRDEGKLSLDDMISRYVPGVPQGDKITLRQLGNHTSGLFNSIENRDFQSAIRAEPRRQWTAQEILAYAFSKPAYHAPGVKWHYSNTNTVLLGAAIEKVTGMSCAEAVRARVLARLGLANTAFAADASLPGPSPHGYRNGRETNWVGYGKIFYDVTGYSASWSGAAGNMYSTVDDLLKATKTLATGTLLGETSRQELHAWKATTQPNLQYGFCLANYRGWLGHFGDVPGFSCFVGYLPSEDTTLVVLANLSNVKDGSVPADRLRDVVIEHLKSRAH
jgi:D-alanyl-D-alanine carboxypeptidase